jgi:hypothetical protein
LIGPVSAEIDASGATSGWIVTGDSAGLHAVAAITVAAKAMYMDLSFMICPSVAVLASQLSSQLIKKPMV